MLISSSDIHQIEVKGANQKEDDNNNLLSSLHCKFETNVL